MNRPALVLVAVLLAGVVALSAVILTRPDPRPVVATTTTTTAPSTTSVVTVPASNVYRDADGHCFGTSSADAARRGLKPDPSCPGSPA